MSGLIVILVILFAIGATRSSRKRKRTEAGQQASRRGRKVTTARPGSTGIGQAPVQAVVSRPADPGEARPHPEPKAANVRASAPEAIHPAMPLVQEIRPTTPPEPTSHSEVASPGGNKASPSPAYREGTISTQGESAAEHAQHLRRAVGEEVSELLQDELRHQLRAANRGALRTAVVMSEVLGKPVSLRQRSGFQR